MKGKRKEPTDLVHIELRRATRHSLKIKVAEHGASSYDDLFHKTLLKE